MSKDFPWVLNDGEQPVPDGVKVDVQFPEGKIIRDIAESFDWEMVGASNDIIKWRYV